MKTIQAKPVNISTFRNTIAEQAAAELAVRWPIITEEQVDEVLEWLDQRILELTASMNAWLRYAKGE